MCKIEIVPKHAGGSVVTIRVTTPLVGKVKVPVKSSSSGSHCVEFTLASTDVERFRAAVQSRRFVSSPACCARSLSKPRTGKTVQRCSYQAILGKIPSPA